MTGQERPLAGVAPPLEEAVRCPLLDRDPEAWLRCCTARFLPVARRVAGNDATARDALQESWTIGVRKNRSTMFSQDELVGMKCRKMRFPRSIHRSTSSCLCVA